MLAWVFLRRSESIRVLQEARPRGGLPREWVGAKGIPLDAWEDWDEPYRVSYREYVMVQREKEAGVTAIREAMLRAKIYDRLDPGHQASTHLHMGTTCMVEQMAVTMQSRFSRFAPSARWRSLGAFGMLDEIRHSQLDMRFSHDLLNEDPRFDWCQKGFHTNEWGVLAVRNFFDDVMLNADCVEAALATSLTVEHGFTNIQFIAMASDAMEAGDVNFSNMLSSIQTDEARHARWASRRSTSSSSTIRSGPSKLWTVESGAGALTLGSGGCSVAFAPVLSPAPMASFPVPRSSNRTCGFPASGFRTRSCLRARKAPGLPRETREAIVYV